MRLAANTLILFSILGLALAQTALSESLAPGVSANSDQIEDRELIELKKEYKKRYKKAYFSSNKRVEKEILRNRIKRGWDLFSRYCRFCHGYSEKAGLRAEMLLNPPLNDDGRLAKTPAEFLKKIYFGGKTMPAFGMGADKGKIVASPQGYAPFYGPRRLSPEEALDIAYYLRYAFRIPGSVSWRQKNGKIELDLTGLD